MPASLTDVDLQEGASAARAATGLADLLELLISDAGRRLSPDLQRQLLVIGYTIAAGGATKLERVFGEIEPGQLKITASRRDEGG